MTLWTPAEINSAIEHYIDANDAATITVETGVSVWSDKSAHGRDYFQGTLMRQPLYSATGFNGVAGAVTFNGIDDYLSGFSWAKPDNTVGSSVFAMFQKSPGASQMYSNVGTGGGRSRYNLAAVGANFGNGGVQLDLLLADDTPQFYYEEIDAGETNPEQRGYANGALTPVSQTVPSRLNSTTGHVLGAYSSSSGFSAVTVHKIMIFNRHLTTDERQRLEGWAAWDAGLESLLPVGHPHRDAAPTVPGSGTTATPAAGSETEVGQTPSVIETTVVAPAAAAEADQGQAPALVETTVIAPDPGAESEAGQSPSIAGTTVIAPTAGSEADASDAPTVLQSILVVPAAETEEGQAPNLLQTTVVKVEPGQEVTTGQAALLVIGTLDLSTTTFIEYDVPAVAEEYDVPAVEEEFYA